ncbi:MAG: T9SS type A sorting domain-containing protein [Saprospiraceae bacterium]|nr:T9SS type A sorting domain-containing protein [Saprospiraceae bacterium]
MNCIHKTLLIFWCGIFSFPQLSSQGFVDHEIGFIHEVNLYIDLPFTFGAAWIDYNNDNLQDIYCTNRLGKDQIYKNLGGNKFEDVTDAVLAGIGIRDGSAVAVADIDNDGWDDLYICNNDQDQLLRNINGEYFVDITETAFFLPIFDIYKGRSTAAAWGDFNNDGFLDLYITHHYAGKKEGFDHDDAADYLYLNNGDLTFSDLSYLIPIDKRQGLGFATTWSDYDLDGDLDLFIINDCRNILENLLYENVTPQNASVFIYNDISLSSSFDECHSSMGVAIADFNNDGYFDLFHTDKGANNFFLNNQGKNMENIASDVGLGIRYSEDYGDEIGSVLTYSWGAAAIDYNLNGKKEIVMSCGWIKSPLYDSLNVTVQDRFFSHDDSLNFVDISHEVNMSDSLNVRSCIYADSDNDGDLDILKTIYGKSVVLKENMTIHPDKPDTTNWIHLKLIGSASNINGVGSKVRVVTENNNVQYFETRSGSNLGGGDSYDAFFGFGNESHLKEINIIFPSGNKICLFDVPTNQVFKIYEPVECQTQVSATAISTNIINSIDSIYRLDATQFVSNDLVKNMQGESFETFHSLQTKHIVSSLDYQEDICLGEKIIFNFKTTNNTVVGVLENRNGEELKRLVGSQSFNIETNTFEYQDTTLEFTFKEYHNETNCAHKEKVVLVNLKVDSFESILLDIQEPSCYKENDGSISVLDTTVNNLIWENGSQDFTLEGLEAGVFTFYASLRDEDCIQYYSVVLKEPEDLELINVDAFTASSSTSQDGGATVSILGGTQPYQYFWYGENNQLISTDSIFENQLPGNYYFEVFDTNGCIIQDSVVIDFVSATNNLSEPQIVVFPNPSFALFNISCTDSSIDAIHIYNVNGELVLNAQDHFSNLRLKVESGVYFAKISIGDKTYTKKLVLLE